MQSEPTQPQQSALFRGPGAACLWLGAYALYQTANLFLHLPKGAPGWLIQSTGMIAIVLYMFLAVAMLAGLASVLNTKKRAAGALAGGVLAWVLMGTLMGGRLPLWPGSPWAASFAALMGRSPLWLLRLESEVIDIGRAVAAAGIGSLVAMLIRDRNILLPASVFAAFADFLMVYSKIGTVHTALQTPQGQRMIQSMSSRVPTPHPAIAPITVGMADYVFLAFFLACAFRFEMNVRATLAAFFAALTLSLFFVALVNRPIPALAPMALAFVAVNFRHFRLSRSELQAMGLAFAIVLVVVGALFVLRH